MNFYNVLKNKFKQFGFISIIKRIVRRVIQPIINVNSFEILIAPNHSFNANYPDNILQITNEMIKFFSAKKELSQKHEQLIGNFIDDKCNGFFATIEDKLAGFALIQSEGIYYFGKKGRFNLSNGFAMFKNLLIYPEYRGKSLGKVLNMVRLQSIPKDLIPIGFVVGDNKYAIRNLEIIGFEKAIKIRTYIYFKRYFRKRIVRNYRNDYLSEKVIQNFIN